MDRDICNTPHIALSLIYGYTHAIRRTYHYLLYIDRHMQYTAHIIISYISIDTCNTPHISLSLIYGYTHAMHRT